MSYIDFKNAISGYKFYCKQTNKQIYTYELFWSNYKPAKCFEKYNSVLRDTNPIN